MKSKTNFDYRWHQDVKPANILALSQPSDSGYGCLFKISDFVTSHFKLKESSSGVQKSKSISFDRTFSKSIQSLNAACAHPDYSTA
jgi:hypothetical protein